MQRKQRNEQGFTLIEMIGVLAIIAILAAIVAPKIFDAINDSKVNSLAEEIHTVKTAVANYYKDTGRFPNQYSDGSASDLMAKPKGVKGWNGPYLDQQVNNPVSPNGFFRVVAGHWKFDIDGDGTYDYGKGTSKTYIAAAWFNGLNASQAKALSNIIDGDGDSSDWFKTGRVRTAKFKDPGSSNNVTLYVFLGASS